MTTSHAPKCRIERLRPVDWARLKRLRIAALTDTPDAFGATVASAQARSPQQWREQVQSLPTFVAIINDNDVGLTRGAPHDKDPHSAMLISMWVAPEARGLGAGERLVETTAKWARSHGYARLMLDVTDDNAPAIALYARLNFQATGETGSLPPPRTHIREHRRALDL